MKMKVSEYIADFLVRKGIEDVFLVTGGGAMHLNDAIGHHPGLHCVYNHHEQACAIAAEGYARYSGKIAAVNVTSGPGGTNALTGVLGGWLDSIPMFILSGQVKRETTIWSTDVPLRQLGDQEYNIVDSVRPMTKYAVMVTDPEEIRYHLEKAFYLATTGRGGPVWLDIPLDVQGAPVETENLKGFSEEKEGREKPPAISKEAVSQALEALHKARRPVVLVGSGIRLAGAHEQFIQAIEKLGVPVVTAWNAHDVLWDSHPLYCGRPGTIGTRGGNFVTENADFLLILGSRLNIRQISYNFRDFAKGAYKVMVDIDRGELDKPTLTIDQKIHGDVKDFLEQLLKEEIPSPSQNQLEWLAWARDIQARYPACLSAYYQKEEPMNPYAFMDTLFRTLPEGETVVTGNGSACVISFQAGEIKKGQRLFTNSGCASMGYGFPAALGVAVARRGKRVLCLDGDGSFQMNLQELQTLVHNGLNVKTIILNNNGYHSIRQTQTNLFKDRPLIGVSGESGISFPSLEKLAAAYGIPYVQIRKISQAEEQLRGMMEMEGPVLCEAILDPSQNFEPKLSSKILPDGRIVSPSLDDMYPFLEREEYEKNKEISK